MNSTALLAGAVILGAAARVAAALPPLPRVSLPDLASHQAWTEQLDWTFGPVVAGCVRSQVAAHVPPDRLDAMLARAGGDPRLFPYLRQAVDWAIARCREQAGS